MLEYRPQRIAATTTGAAIGLAMLACANSGTFPVKDSFEISNGKALRAGVIDTSSQVWNFSNVVDVYSVNSFDMLAGAAEAFNMSMLSMADTLGAEFSKVLDDNLWDLLIR